MPYRRPGDGAGVSEQVSFPWSTLHTNTLEAKIYYLTEKLYKLDKDITQLKQMTHRDTDEYVDPDMFGASAIPKYNPTASFKTSPNFDESGNTYGDLTFGFGKYISQHDKGSQTGDTSNDDHITTNRVDRNIRYLTLNS